MINAGDFNKRVDIVRHTTITDKDGFTTVQDTVICSAWAKVNTTKGFTLVSQGSNFEDATTRLLIRKPSVEITRKDIVKYKAKDWKIRYLNNIDDDDAFIELQVEEVTQ
jgi:SPP1 family predicted phage head-tail adaptor